MDSREQAFSRAFTEYTADLESTVTNASFIRWLRAHHPDLIEGSAGDELFALVDALVGLTRFHTDAR